MPNIYEFNLPEGHDDPESPNYIPFSNFNKRIISLNTSIAMEKLGLTNGRTPLTDKYIKCFIHPKSMYKK
jgi:hypothetical protein